MASSSILNQLPVVAANVACTWCSALVIRDL
jgi:hypothetical protein